MVLTCVATDRTTSNDTQRYLQMAEEGAGPGIFRFISNDTLNFNDPSRVIKNSTTEWISTSRGDLTHGFPSPNTMTNVVFWRKNFFVYSDGLIWTTNRDTKAWNVIAVRNSDDFTWEPSSRHDFLYLEYTREGGMMTMVKFYPSRANCNYVQLHEYFIFDDQEDIPHFLPPTNIHPEPVSHNPSNLGSSSMTGSRPSEGSVERLAEREQSDPASLTGLQLPTTEVRNAGSDYSSCKICLNDYNALPPHPRSAIIPCGHVACSECIRKSRRESNRCPFCRQNIGNTFRLYE